MCSGKVKLAVQLAATFAQRHGLEAAVPQGSDLPEQAQVAVSAELQRLHAAGAEQLEELRGRQREAQQGAQQRLSTVEARLASFQTDADSKASSQAAVECAPPPARRTW